MIYVIFLCNSVIGDCLWMRPYEFQSAAECKLTMLKVFGPRDSNGNWVLPALGKESPDINGKPQTVFVNGRLYLNTMSPAQWYECDGQPTWQTVQ